MFLNLMQGRGDADRQPLLHLALDPANGPQAKLDSTRKAPLGLQLVDHGSAQTRHLAHLGQTKYLKRLV